MLEFKMVKQFTRSQYSQKYLSKSFCKSHRSYELDALSDARKQKKKIQLPPSRFSRIKRPVIRRVKLSDIRWHDDVGYTLTYCIYDDWKYSALPKEINCWTWCEIYQAYKEAVKIQMQQGIISRF
tara:strand:+ start:288 stop:662 length:375 start_codon:yes stop_codon:yes gene_type:complete